MCHLLAQREEMLWRYPSQVGLAWLVSRYHPYKPIARHQLLPADLPRRLDFCNWIVSIPDQELMQFLFSDEANYQLCGYVNSQNARRYAPLKRSDPGEVNGGRPGHFFVEKRNSPKVMVFSGVKADGLFSVQNI